LARKPRETPRSKAACSSREILEPQHGKYSVFGDLYGLLFESHCLCVVTVDPASTVVVQYLGSPPSVRVKQFKSICVGMQLLEWREVVSALAAVQGVSCPHYRSDGMGDVFWKPAL
jgi:hypothetical protein